MGFEDELRRSKTMVPRRLRRFMPNCLKRLAGRLYWSWFDTRDYLAEAVGHVPSHTVRNFAYRRLLGVKIGACSSVHRGCRFYRPVGVCIGSHTVINRDVLLDGRSGLSIGNNVSVSEGVAILTLEHDVNSPHCENRGGPVQISDYVFVGARALILPGNTIGQGAVVAAGAVITHDVAPFTIVGGVPARQIGERRHDLVYQPNYRKFLG